MKHSERRGALEDGLPGPRSDDQRAMLADLLARVEKAERRDGDLNVDLDVALFQPEPWRPERRRAPNAGGCTVTTYVSRIDGRRTYGTTAAPNYTGSLDEALALCSRALPGWDFELSVQHSDGRVDWYCEMGDSLRNWNAWSTTPALSLLAAMLKALVAKGEG